MSKRFSVEIVKNGYLINIGDYTFVHGEVYVYPSWDQVLDKIKTIKLEKENEK